MTPEIKIILDFIAERIETAEARVKELEESRSLIDNDKFLKVSFEMYHQYPECTYVRCICGLDKRLKQLQDPDLFDNPERSV